MAVTLYHVTVAMVAVSGFLALVPTGVGSLKVAAFKVDTYGVTKAGKPEVMNILAQIINRYDIILIQEIRDASGVAIVDLLDLANNMTTNPFSMTISPRLGRTNYKEQYAYFYRSGSGLTLTQTHMYDDGDESLNTATEIFDKFMREPFVAVFSSSTTQLSEFALAAIHISPDFVKEELSELVNVIADVQNTSIVGIDDVMVMGDMNADCTYFPQIDRDIPIKTDTTTYQWLIDDDADTAVASSKNCAYDRFISAGSGFLATTEGGVVPNSARVFRFDLEYGLSVDEAKAVSDDYVIEFELKPATTPPTGTETPPPTTPPPTTTPPTGTETPPPTTPPPTTPPTGTETPPPTTPPPTTTPPTGTEAPPTTTTAGPRQYISIASVYVTVNGTSLPQKYSNGNTIDHFMSNYTVTNIAGDEVGSLYTGDTKSTTLKAVMVDLLQQALCDWPMTINAEKRKYAGKQKCTLTFDVLVSDLATVFTAMDSVKSYYVITGLL